MVGELVEGGDGDLPKGEDGALDSGGVFSRW